MKTSTPSPQGRRFGVDSNSDDTWQEEILTRMHELDELNAKLSSENARLTNKLQDVAAASEHDVALLRKKLAEATQDRQKSLGDLAEIQSHVKLIEKEHDLDLKHSREETAAQKEHVRALEATVASMKIEHSGALAEAESRNKDLTQQFEVCQNKLKTIKQTHGKEVKALEEKIETLSAERLRASEEARKRVGRMHSVEEESKVLQEKLSQSQTWATKYKDKLIEVATLVEEVARCLSFASTQMAPPTFEAIPSMVASLQYNFKLKLTTLAEEMRNQNDESQRMRGQLVARDHQIEDICQQVRDYETLTSMLQSQLTLEVAQHEKCKNLQSGLEKRVQELTSAASTMQMLVEQLDPLRKSHEEVLTRLETVQRERDTAVQNVHRLREEVSANHKHIQDLTMELQCLRTEYKELEMQRIVLEKEKEGVMIELRTYGESKNRAQQKSTRLQEQIRTMQHDLDKLQQENTSLKERAFKADTGNTQKHSQVQLLQEKLKVQCLELEKSHSAIDELRKQLRESMSERSESRARCDAATASLKETQQRLEKLESQHAVDTERLVFLQHEVNAKREASPSPSPSPSIFVEAAGKRLSTQPASLSLSPVPCTTYFDMFSASKSASKSRAAIK